MTPLFRRSTASDAAFERLYRRHVTDVYRYSLAVLGAPADAEDVTQTTFLNAYRALQRGEEPKKPENWLIAIAHNVCRQRFRQAGRRPHEVEFDDLAGGTEDEHDGPTAEDLRRAFSELPPNQREALVMRELEGRSYAEIAAVLEISTSALETLIFRARRTLREQLEERLSCDEAAFAISKEADGRLTSEERTSLRAHLRACPECSTAAQRQRAMRRALKVMLAVPLPQSLASFFGGSAGVGAATAAGAGAAGVALKAATVLTAGVLVGGGAYVGVKELPAVRGHGTTTASVPTAAKATRAAPAPVALAPLAVSRDAPLVATRGSGAKKQLRRAHPPKAGKPTHRHKAGKPAKAKLRKAHGTPARKHDRRIAPRHPPGKAKPAKAVHRQPDLGLRVVHARAGRPPPQTKKAHRAR